MSKHTSPELAVADAVLFAMRGTRGAERRRILAEAFEAQRRHVSVEASRLAQDEQRDLIAGWLYTKFRATVRDAEAVPDKRSPFMLAYAGGLFDAALNIECELFLAPPHEVILRALDDEELLRAIQSPDVSIEALEALRAERRNRAAAEGGSDAR